MTQNPRARICPPCTDNCRQGRDCSAREERGLMLILAVLLAFAFVGVPILALAAWLVGANP
jgi:hypothetical protein